MLDLASLLRFPCDQSKRPLIGAWQRNAARDDYSDWPLVGVPTGEANGFDVLDIDLAGSGWWASGELERSDGYMPAASEGRGSRVGMAHLTICVCERTTQHPVSKHQGEDQPLSEP